MAALRPDAPSGQPPARAGPATIALATLIEEALSLWCELTVAPGAVPTDGAGQVRVRRLVGAAEALLAALDEPRPPPTPAPPHAPAASDARAALTRRELEVLRLMTEGRTDREVAAVLGVSHRTATTHVAGILSKLGVSTRTAAVARAIRAGLV